MRSVSSCWISIDGEYAVGPNGRLAGYSGRNIISRAVIDYDDLMLNAVRVSTLLVAIVLILVVGAFRHFGCCTGELPTAGTPSSAIRKCCRLTLAR